MATLNGVSFEGFIVSRRRKFLLVDEAIKQEAGVAVGEIVTVTVAPSSVVKK
jgi:hypothetical protein